MWANLVVICVIIKYTQATSNLGVIWYKSFSYIFLLHFLCWKIGALVTTLQEFFGTEPEKSADLSKIVNRHHFARLTSYLIEKGVAESIVHGGRYNEDKL
jgi:hypothetical protein